MAKWITKEEIEEVVKDCKSFRELTIRLGRLPVGGNIMQMIHRCKKFKIDTLHFTGKAHLAGKPSRAKLRAEEVLMMRTPEQGREAPHRLRRALLESGMVHVCEQCGIDEWCGQKLILQIDHKDGRYWNNVRENLRFLCPNCHSLTETFGSKVRD